MSGQKGELHCGSHLIASKRLFRDFPEETQSFLTSRRDTAETRGDALYALGVALIEAERAGEARDYLRQALPLAEHSKRKSAIKEMLDEDGGENSPRREPPQLRAAQNGQEGVRLGTH